MLTAEIIAKALAGLLGATGLFLLVGWLSYKLNKNLSFQNPFERIFWYLFIGLLQTISVYAIVVTGFQTILLPVPFLLLLFIYKKEPRFEPAKAKVSKSTLLTFVVTTIFVYLFYYLQAFISWDDAYVRFASGDHTFYARVAEYLNITGKENSALEYLYADRFTVTPYHYGDIWFCAFVGWVTHIKTGFALILVVYPILALVFTIGLAGFLFQNLPANKSSHWILFCIPALFLSGFSSFFPTFILKADVFAQSAAGYPKTLWISCFLMATYMMVRARGITGLFILVAVAGLSFINIFPTLICAAVLWALLAVSLKLIRWKDVIAGVLALAFTLCFLFIFYRILTVGGAAVVNDNGLGRLLNIESIKTGFNILIGGSFQLFMLAPFFLLFIVVAFVFYKRQGAFMKSLIKPEVAWSIILAFAGLICWAALFAFTTEAVQFFHNVFIPLSAILLSTIIFWIVIHRVHIVFKLMAVTLVFLAVAKSRKFDFHVWIIEKREWLSLQHFLKGNQQVVFATFKDLSEFPTLFHKNTRFAHALPVLHYLYTPYINESLNTPFLSVDSASPYKSVEASLISQSSFDYFSKQLKDVARFGSAEQQMQSFVEQNEVNYITVSEKALVPAFVYSITQDSLILPSEGWKVYRVGKEHINLSTAIK
jgi:hypothetical protein